MRNSAMSMLLFLLCVVGHPASVRAAPPQGPILALDAGGHTAIIWKVVFTPDGKELITVSNDKTVRSFDVATGEPLRVLRPPIGRGAEGMLYAAAISPDGGMLAVGGFPPGSGRDGNPIFIISLDRGEILRRLIGHTSAISALAFSPDGGRLLSGSHDHTARIWNVATGVCERTLSGHTGVMSGVVFSPDGRQCATASYDMTAIIWSVADGRRVATLTGHTASLNSIDWKGDRLATGGQDQTVRIWTSDGKLLQTVKSPGQRSISSVKLSRGADRVLFTHANTGGGRPLTGVIDVATGRTLVEIDQHTNTIFDATWSPDGTLVASTGGDLEEILLWRASDGQVQRKIVGRGRKPFAAAWSPSGEAIAWGEKNDGDMLLPMATLERAFDLSRLEFTAGARPAVSGAAAPLEGNWRRAGIEHGSLKLQASGRTAIAVVRDGETTATLQPELEYERLHNWVQSATFLSENYAAVGGSFDLWMYDARTGARLRQFIGHSGAVYAVAPAPDGRYLLSGGADATLRIWNIPTDEASKPSPFWAGLGFATPPIQPLLSLFFAGDDWIAWTPEGYYAASPGGERLMGWHVNNGPDKLASFYPAAQFRKQLYRPEAIKLLLKTGSIQRALEESGSNESVTEVAQNLPPRIEIVTPAGPLVATDQSELPVTVAATQVGANPVTSLQLLLNGRPLGGQGGIVKLDGKNASPRHTFTVPLISGVTHRLQARADSAVSYGLSDEIEVVVKSATPAGPAGSAEHVLPSLYVLAIGVADYDNSELKLNFAAHDARNVAAAFEAHSRGLYRTVETHVLTDKQATQRGILGGLGWLKRQMTQHDVGVVFYSGHGDRDENANFFLLPSDVDRDELIVTGVPDAQVKQILQAIPGRVLVILDACHAGTLGGDRRKSAVGLTDDLVRDLATDDFGVVTMASSMGREFSLESAAEQSGVFTLALTEGLSGKADFNGDGVVYFSELDAYVSDRVKELSKGRQHPATAKPATVRSFPLSRPGAAR